MDQAYAFLIKRQNIANENNDPNVGKARGTSTSAFASTLIVNLVIFAVLFLSFTALRRLNRRIYAPRTYVSGSRDKRNSLRDGSDVLL